MYLRLILLPDTPRRVARGLAAGVFTGSLPIIPFQSISGMGLAWLFRGSLLAAPIGAFITNPVTIPPFYTVAFYIGRIISPFGHKAGLPINWNVGSLTEFVGDVFWATTIGGVVMGLVLAPLTYWFTYNYVGRLQIWERRKMRERFGITPPSAR
jgi:uncharacterized protein (DUF2062 family)